MTNVVVLIGRLARPAQLRHLPSGDAVAEYQLTVPRAGQRADSVPVVWEQPPPSATDYDTDAEVVVVGRVRRRFFRAATGTGSRTEVVAEAVVPARQVKRARAALAGACAAIEEVATACRRQPAPPAARRRHATPPGAAALPRSRPSGAS